ncbi:beta-glucuronidase [Actinoplanes sp. NPDC049668]|uniref:beta-glucuronidase n=1 Tax=unclassified Actinoplanes TaxID=2626549 RepID=UPI0033B464FE
MLRPQDTATRERKLLNGLWRFALDPGGAGRAGRWFTAALRQAREMAVPASYNEVAADARVRDHLGEVWYQTEVRVPRGWAGDRIVLHFESATHRATVWVDDTEVVSHEGGYTPFEADVTNLVTAGETARITVAVDNTLTFESVPPGVVEDTAAGPRQRYWHDFFNYAGLHRSVWLYATPAAHITDIAVVTDLDESTGVLHYVVEAAGAGSAAPQVVLRDAGGTVVGRRRGARGVLTVRDVHPWAPGDGYLYDLEVQLVTATGEIVDSYHQSVGVRTVSVAGNRFLINGEPFYFTGFGKHEDLAVTGKGHNDAFLVHDFDLFEWIGANSFRTSHYPYSEDVLDYADRRGIVVIDEVAAVGLNVRTGEGVFGAADYPTFSDDTINERTREVHAQAIRELVARDKNHPSVVIWSIANEPESGTEAAEAYFRPLFELTRELDASRPVSFANDALAPHGRCRVAQFADLLMLNRYYGWYVLPGDLAAAEIAWEEELRAWGAENKPILIAEYGADAYPGLHSVAPQPWTEEYQVAYLDMNHRVFDRIDAVVGEHVWNFADFATTPGIMRVGGNRKGVFTRDRRPKAAAHVLRQRWLKES